MQPEDPQDWRGLSGARNIPASKLELIEIKAPTWKNSGQGAE